MRQEIKSLIVKNFESFVEETKDNNLDRKEKNNYTMRDFTLDTLQDFKEEIPDVNMPLTLALYWLLKMNVSVMLNMTVE